MVMFIVVVSTIETISGTKLPVTINVERGRHILTNWTENCIDNQSIRNACQTFVKT